MNFNITLQNCYVTIRVEQKRERRKLPAFLATRLILPRKVIMIEIAHTTLPRDLASPPINILMSHLRTEISAPRTKEKKERSCQQANDVTILGR